LICESRAILTQEAAIGIVLLVGLAEGWLRASHSTRKPTPSQPPSPLAPWYSLLLSGLASVVPSYRSALQVAADITRYQFGGFNYQCLRCGATFEAAQEQA
jgi:hypothetical protein